MNVAESMQSSSPFSVSFSVSQVSSSISSPLCFFPRFLVASLCLSLPLGRTSDRTILHWIARFFFFSFPFSVSQYCLFFLFCLERANVMQSDEKKSVGFFNCNVFFNFILTGFFFNRLFDLYFFNCKRGRVMKGKTLYRASVLN